MQNGLCIWGAGKELEERFSIFWSSVSLFPPNTQQKMRESYESSGFERWRVPKWTKENKKGTSENARLWSDLRSQNLIKKKE